MVYRIRVISPLTPYLRPLWLMLSGVWNDRASC